MKENFLIATHGELSAAFIETASMIIGDYDIDFFSMTKEKSGQDAEKEIRQMFQSKNPEEHYIVLTDLYGGSVANIFTTLLMEGEEFELVTGVNLPMVLSILLSPETDIKKKVQQAITDAKEGIRYVNEVITEQIEEDDLDDFLNED